MLVIGLTGGIGSGKTTVANLFAEHGVPIIDADVIAREITQPHEKAYEAIVRHFGHQIILPSDQLDRAQLRKIIFAQTRERRWLENLLHPIIRDKIEQRIHLIDAPYCITVIPLLLEVTPYSFIDRILIIDTPEIQQIDRVIKRDKIEKETVYAILESQIAREERLTQADDVIINDGSLADLETQVTNLHAKYIQLAQMK